MVGPTTANLFDLSTLMSLLQAAAIYLSLSAEPGPVEVDEGPPETEPSFRI